MGIANVFYILRKDMLEENTINQPIYSVISVGNDKKNRSKVGSHKKRQRIDFSGASSTLLHKEEGPKQGQHVVIKSESNKVNDSKGNLGLRLKGKEDCYLHPYT